MAKIGEDFIEDGGKLIHTKRHNWDAALQQAEAYRQNGNQSFGDSKFVGVIDMGMMEIWAAEAGIKFNDPAMKEVVKRKMMSGEFDKLRVWKGSY